MPLALSAAAAVGLAAHVGGQARLRARSAALELRYRRLVEETPVSFYISALEGPERRLYVSPEIVDLLGYSLERWTENTQLFEEILHPLDGDRVLRAIERAKAGGGPSEAEYRLLRRDGGVAWVHDRAVTVRDERGRLRTRRAQDAVPGVGLGLSIAKAIVEAHDARISKKSREDAGTTFYVDLPAAARVQAA